MGTPAQVVEQGIQRGQEDQRARQRELEDEQRKVTLKTLQEDAATPQDKLAAIQAVYHKDPGVLKQHVENLTRRITGKQPQPVVSPQQAQQARIAPLAARGKTPDQQSLDAQTASGDLANKQHLQLTKDEAEQKQKQAFDLIDTYITDPEQNKAAKEDYVRKQAGITQTFKNLPGAAGQPYRSPNGTWVRPVQAADGSITEEPMPAGYTGPQAKPTKPIYKVIRNHAVLIDPNTGKVLHDLGLATEAKTTTRQAAIPDNDGVVHIVNLTSVSVPGQGSVDVDVAPGEEGSPAPKGPAPKSSTAGAPPKRTPAPNGSVTLPFRKATPASNKAQTDVVEATKLSSLADQVMQHPNDAINQKRLAVALERASAGRFTTQALDYVIKAGWGNTIEQWANNPSTGALPADVMRQLVDGAHQNLKAAQDAVPKGDQPAPKSGGKEIQYKIVNGELVQQ